MQNLQNLQKILQQMCKTSKYQDILCLSFCFISENEAMNEHNWRKITVKAHQTEKAWKFFCSQKIFLQKKFKTSADFCIQRTSPSGSPYNKTWWTHCALFWSSCGKHVNIHVFLHTIIGIPLQSVRRLWKILKILQIFLQFFETEKPDLHLFSDVHVGHPWKIQIVGEFPFASLAITIGKAGVGFFIIFIQVTNHWEQ